jgi:hypothetical protein
VCMWYERATPAACSSSGSSVQTAAADREQYTALKPSRKASKTRAESRGCVVLKMQAAVAICCSLHEVAADHELSAEEAHCYC